MKESKEAPAALTHAQQRLVEGHIGLVAVHLRRYVSTPLYPRRDREREDLFQEGCLGLIQAARTYQEESGIPFPAFALPRIHNAVSRALQTRFHTIALPVRRKNTGTRESEGECHPVCSPSDPKPGTRSSLKKQLPRLQPLGHDAATHLPDDRKTRPDRPEDDQQGVTIGEHMRRKYERAVRRAAKKLSQGQSTRGDRDKLVAMLTEERFMISSDEQWMALREIARRTKSSYARVAQCDRQLSDAIREDLEADPEFHELQRQARANANGQAASVDSSMELTLAGIVADECVERLHRLNDSGRCQLLYSVLACAGCDFKDIVRRTILKMKRGQREELIRQMADAEGVCSTVAQRRVG